MKKIFHNEKIFIAGAHGMVGKSITRRILSLGYCNAKEEIFTPSRSELDLSNYEKVNEWFTRNKPTIVIFAAAKVGGILANKMQPAEFFLENLKIQTNVIEISFKHNVKRFLFLGSSCIYPKYAKQPIKEEYLLSGKLEPTNQWYAIAKIAGIKLCESLKLQYGFDTLSLMPTNLYGPFDNYSINRSHVLPAFIRRFSYAVKNKDKIVTCWGDGSPLREFLHVDDMASAILFTLENWNQIKMNKNISFLNVGSGEEISIFKLAEKIARMTGFEGKIEWDIKKPNGTPRKRLDISKITNLGWKPTILLDEGIKQTINCYEKETSK